MKYSSTKELHILTHGPHRVSIARATKKKINAEDKKELADNMRSLLEFRNSEPGHGVHKMNKG